VEHGTLTEEQRTAAEAEAHRLAGSLGTFGLEEGSRAARALELMLSGANDLEAEKLSDLVSAIRLAISKSRF
jgi:HPt (histidine-containing phosphotransfer) domain-containing protein